MSDHDFAVQVRINRTENGWSRTVVDTPTFYFLSDPQFGGMYDAGSAERAVRDMFASATADGDDVHITISPYCR